MAIGVVAYAGGAMWWDIDAARMASEIEIKIHSNGTVEDVEYHVPLDQVPPAVKAKMGELYPGLPLKDLAEKEYEGGTLFFELAVVKDGMKHEVMFTPAGQPHSKEIQVAVEDPKYPELPGIRDMVVGKYGEQDLVFEVILDAEDQLVEYHVKVKTDAGTPQEKRHKLIVTKDGFLAGAFYEVAAEIEVPVPPR